jgi:plasmid stability protein
MGNVQIRNVPPELHRKLKARAAEKGLTLSEYLLGIVEREASLPTPAEIVERLRALPEPELDEPPSATLRRIRDAG